MKKIDRKQAEELFQNVNVINSSVTQDEKELNILFTLSNNEKCLYRYSLLDHNKSYFLYPDLNPTQNQNNN